MANIAIFWDWQNCRATESQIRYLILLAFFNGNIVFKRAYSDWKKENEKLAEILYCNGFEMPHIPSDKNKPNRTDQKLIDDCIQLIVDNPDINIVILVSADGDYKELVTKLKSQGKKVIVFAKSENSTSNKLKKVADSLYFFNQIDQLFQQLQFAI
jgi:uncharacterized protein (TIGR00288 family)